MAVTPSTMLPLGTTAPDFRLVDATGAVVSLSDFDGAPALVVVFMCNHCPYVKHIRRGLSDLEAYCAEHDVALVGINANDYERYPDDSPARMLEEASDHGWTFPYLVDATQEVAKAYRAACTPDFYVFDGDRKLLYRGQLDDSRPANGLPVTGRDVKAAVDAALRGSAPPEDQVPSIGCGIKWKPGNEPDYVS